MRRSDRDTIVAIATAPGEGAIGIVRLSGEDALAVADRCFRGPLTLPRLESRRLTYGSIVHRNQVLDEVLVSVMRAPRSYTGEDTVEFNCHGGTYVLKRVVTALQEAGARSAGPGEFTKRAFLNGRLDLTQAEAVADLISARGDLSLQSAYFQLRGGLRHQFEAISTALREALVFLEAGLDFAEDADVDMSVVLSKVTAAERIVRELIDSYRRGRLVREGALVVLAGRPNVGKSSLMNRLLEQDRSIVTEIPGTTRDTIEASVDLGGIVVTLVDTAGLRATGDPVEQEGTRRTRISMESADLVLEVVEAQRPPEPGEFEVSEGGPDRFLVMNKIDLGEANPGWNGVAGDHPKVAVSAKTGTGLEELREAVRAVLMDGAEPTGEVVTHERHVELLKSAEASLEGARRTLDQGLPAELAAVEVRGALDSLADIVGETTPDDILDQIFKSFCIGK